MFASLRNLFVRKDQPPRPSVPPGERVYAIGDIHGRLDLFEELIHAIERDDLESPPRGQTTVVLLGDLVDRGPSSAQVIARAREWQIRRPVRILAGNHEEMFLESFDSTEILRHFLKHGGQETVLSYGLSPATYNDASLEEIRQLMHQIVPRHDRDFLAGFEPWVSIGDYLFVHAGIRPEVPLAEQQRRDLLWIREPFLRYTGPHLQFVIHGHTICETVDEQDNRIGVDTGAFRSGILTAIVLEGEHRRYIQAVEEAGLIAIHKGEQAG
ncbi:MAG: metallophosphoesterase family protein [Sphingomonadaceae bacterium]